MATQGNVEYANEECKKILECGNESERALTAGSLAVIKHADSMLNVEDLINDHKKLETAENKRFTFNKSPAQTLAFTLKYSHIHYQSKSAIAIILQDQTLFDQLKNVQEKHQRVYLASVVHDIRTPLNGILGMIEMIEEVVKDSSVSHFISAARASAKLLLFLTYDITDFSQIEAGIITINQMSWQPEQIVDEIIQLLEFSFQRKGIQLSKCVSANVPQMILSDKNRYMQILLNLIGNALKFTFRGHVLIKLEYSTDSDWLITSVEDTGIGVKEEDLPNLFRLFGKIKDNANINPTGVGMGLMICKRLTELMGGVIKVTSVYNIGTTFTFSIKCNLGMSPPSNVLSSNDFISVALSSERHQDVMLLNDHYQSSIKLIKPHLVTCQININ